MALISVVTATDNRSNVLPLTIHFVDRSYDDEDPDHWRVPPDSPEIAFTFA